MAGQGLGPTQGDLVPRPDPSDRTVIDLRREILNVVDRVDRGDANTLLLIQSRLDGILVRIDGNDTAVKLLRDGTDKVPASIEAAVNQLQSLTDVKFASIDVQFRERDERSVREARDGKVAIDAALKAASDAISKTELGIAKQIDLITASIIALTDRMSGKFEDTIKNFTREMDEAKYRINNIEGVARGVVMQKMETAASGTSEAQHTGLSQAWIGIGLTAIGLAIVIAVALLKP